jgi:hypothetical protein
MSRKRSVSRSGSSKNAERDVPTQALADARAAARRVPRNTGYAYSVALLAKEFASAYEAVERCGLQAAPTNPSLTPKDAGASPDEVWSPPIHDQVKLYLLCHALELALKGWLLLRDPKATPSSIRKRGHKIGALGRAVTGGVPGEEHETYYHPVELFLPLIGQLETSYDNPFDYTYVNLDANQQDTRDHKVPEDMKAFADFVAECCADLLTTCAREIQQVG